MEREILKKAAAFFAKDQAMKFAWIDAEKAEFPVIALCRISASRPSGFYAWRRDPSPHMPATIAG